MRVMFFFFRHYSSSPKMIINTYTKMIGIAKKSSSFSNQLNFPLKSSSLLDIFTAFLADSEPPVSTYTAYFFTASRAFLCCVSIGADIAHGFFYGLRLKSVRHCHLLRVKSS